MTIRVKYFITHQLSFEQFQNKSLVKEVQLKESFFDAINTVWWYLSYSLGFRYHNELLINNGLHGQEPNKFSKTMPPRTSCDLLWCPPDWTNFTCVNWEIFNLCWRTNWFLDSDDFAKIKRARPHKDRKTSDLRANVQSKKHQSRSQEVLGEKLSSWKDCDSQFQIFNLVFSHLAYIVCCL